MRADETTDDAERCLDDAERRPVTHAPHGSFAAGRHQLAMHVDDLAVR
jgi:hypothetical protein